MREWAQDYIFRIFFDLRAKKLNFLTYLKKNQYHF